MKFPSKSNLVPLARKYANDRGYKLLSSGKVSNGKRGLMYSSYKSLYDLGIFLYRNRFIVKHGKRYKFTEFYGNLPYPYLRGVDLRETL